MKDQQIMVTHIDNYDGRGKGHIIKRCKVYKCCYCSYHHHDQQRTIRHKNKCKFKSMITRSQAIDERQKARVDQMVQDANNNYQQSIPLNFGQDNHQHHLSFQNSDLLELKKTVQNIKKQMKQLKGTAFSNASNEAYIFSERVFDRIGDIIIKTMKTKFASILENAITTGIQIDRIKNVICSNILVRVNQISFDDILFQFSQKLKDTHLAIQKEAKQKLKASETSRTIQNNERAFKFFLKFQQFHFLYQIQLVNQLSQLGPWQRKDYSRYFSLLKQHSHFFTKFPPLPKFQSSKYKRITPQISINQIKEEICRLYSQNQTILACDIFMALCMGLRKRDLERIYFKTSSGQFCHSVKIKQHKNNHITKRYVPESFVQMMHFCGVTYPIGNSRFNAARQRCIEKFRTFYSLRHLCITHIVTSLMKSHYGDFHKSASTTSKFYLDQNEMRFIDAAFQIKINKPESYEKKQRKIIIDLTQEQAHQQIITEKKYQITIDSMDRIVQSVEDDSILMKQVNPRQIIQDNTLKSCEKSKTIAKINSYSKFGIQLDSISKKSLQQVLSQIQQNPLNLSYILNNMAQKGYAPSNHNILKSVSELIPDHVFVYQVFNSESDQPVEQSIFNSKLQDSSGSTVVISKCENQYISNSLTNVKIQKKQLDTEINFDEKGPSKKYYEFTTQNPRCSCKKGYLWVTTNTNEQAILVCDFCQKERKNIENKIFSISDLYHSNQMNIKTLFKSQIRDNHISIKKMNMPNNIKLKIEEIYGPGSYSKDYYYTLDIPKFLKTPYCLFSKKLSQQIKYNRLNEQYLPIKIAPSSIQGGGNGLFSECDIEAGSIIVNYIGPVSSIFTSDIKNQSLFTLGWCMTQLPRQVYICPRLKLNAGRFINSSNSKYPANCSPRIGVLDNKEFCLYIYAHKFILKGEEFLYDYGENYSASHSVKEMEQFHAQQMNINLNLHNSSVLKMKNYSIKDQKFKKPESGVLQMLEDIMDQGSQKKSLQIIQQHYRLCQDVHFIQNQNYADYHLNGYHPVYLGQIYNSKYKVIQKIGWGHSCTTWLVQIEKKHRFKRKIGNFFCMKIQKSQQSYNESALDQVNVLNRMRRMYDVSPGGKWSLFLLNLTSTSKKQFIPKNYQPLELIENFNHYGMHGKHHCIVLELLGPTVFDILMCFRKSKKKMPQWLIKKITIDVLIGLVYIHSYAQIIHTDLKPDNISLVLNSKQQKLFTDSLARNKTQPISMKFLKYYGQNENSDIFSKKEKFREQLEQFNDFNSFSENQNFKSLRIVQEDEKSIQIQWKNTLIFIDQNSLFKIIDYGNACFKQKHFTEYIQSKQYRSPEVFLKNQYNQTADIWSLACIIYQMLTSDFLFNPIGIPNVQKSDIMFKIVEILGPIDTKFCLKFKNSWKYFKQNGELLNGNPLEYKRIDKILYSNYGYDDKQSKKIHQFLQPMLHLDPSKRISASKCLKSSWLWS